MEASRLAVMVQLYDHRLRAVDEQGLPVVQGAVRDAFGAVPGHHQFDRRRLGALAMTTARRLSPVVRASRCSG